ncbi:hypothetical protein P8452_14813 [Trifolium repens]|nr:hypothetical protein P8452_14813 [Trifolium repens]
MNRSIKFLSLKELSMSFVTLGDEHLIERLISCCPLIEYITLKDCFVLSSGGDQRDAIKSLNLNGLQKLKGVDVSRIQEVFVDSPSLENLHYFPKDFDRTFKIDFDRCRNLKKLDLWSMTNTFFTDNWFLELFEKFSFLESLKFSFCSMPERIDISSAQLKVFELLYCSNLKDVNIDAPNLLSCRYDGTVVSKPIINFLRSFSQLEVNIKDMDLRDLREILQNIKPPNVLKSHSLLIDFAILDALMDPIIVLQVSSPRLSIKHLDLCLPPWTYKSMFLSIVEIILSSCCPSTISFSFELHNSGPFIEFFYEILIKRKDDNCFCKSSVTKCWWHGLKDVMFATSTKIDENVNLMTMLESLPPSMEKEKISFILKF